MKLLIQQALHGYSDGHRLISSSVSLSSLDARTMVVMSDLSGPGIKPTPSGYLTGYPLSGAGKYVLARTWIAGEMSRPGCVWTHSLIIDNSDLAVLSSVDELLAAFTRPKDLTQNHDYTKPLSINVGRHNASKVSSRRANQVVNALYSAPDDTILVEVEDAEGDEQLVLAIWMQQWPRLRRAFGFCTLAGIDRSRKGEKLDLQFVRSLTRQVKTHFPGALTADEVNDNTALQPLVFDLAIGGENSKFREFLRKTGGDVDGGRRAMEPLCLLYTSLFSGNNPNLTLAVQALEKLKSFGSQQARSVRILIAQRATEQIEKLDSQVFNFVVDTVEASGSTNDDPIAAKRVGIELWRRSPTRFIEAIHTDSFLGEASLLALPALGTTELIEGLRENSDLIRIVVRARPDLLERPEFWRLDNVEYDVLDQMEIENIGRVVSALIYAGKSEPALSLVSKVQSDELASILNSSVDEPVLNNWLIALSRVPSKMADVLDSGRICHRSIVVALARFSDPDSIRIKNIEDPWLVALRSATSESTQNDEDYLAAFLLSRALGESSQAQADLFLFAYSVVYQALRERRLPADVEHLFKWRLDWSGWFVLDNLTRLRETVVRRFIGKNLDPMTFVELSDDARIIAELIVDAARTTRGQRYLRKAAKKLDETDNEMDKAKAGFIRKVIN